MNVQRSLKVTLSVFLIICSTTSKKYPSDIRHLTQHVHHVEAKESPELIIFCYEGKAKSIFSLWESIYVNTDLQPQSYNFCYDGPNVDDVYEMYLARPNNIEILSKIKLNPFSQICIGIKTKEKYQISLQIDQMNYWNSFLSVFGVLLFFRANVLSKRILLYYVGVMLLGRYLIFFILLYCLGKLSPGFQQVLMFTGAVYRLIDSLFYQEHLIFISALAGSFGVCYYFGPITFTERTTHIICWILQGLGIIAVLLSTYYWEAAIFQIVLMLFI